jgi:hypothetical protein
VLDASKVAPSNETRPRFTHKEYRPTTTIFCER